MKLFVTGATGFIGSHFINAAANEGHYVSALKRSSASKPRIDVSTKIKWIVSEMQSVKEESLAGIDCLVHLAASGVSEQKDWNHLFQINVLDSVNIWLTAITAGVKRIVICGSCFEYGQSGESYEAIPTDAPLLPKTPYAASKAAATMAAIALSETGRASFSVLRPFHVFGAGEHEDRLWPSLKRAAISGEDYSMTFGEQVRDFIPVSLAVRRILDECKIEENPMKFTIKNVGTGCPQRVIDFCEYWWSQWKAHGKLLAGKIPYRENEVMRYVPEMKTNQ